jgi:hypothetical protein
MDCGITIGKIPNVAETSATYKKAHNTKPAALCCGHIRHSHVVPKLIKYQERVSTTRTRLLPLLVPLQQV